ncbi:unnamed protein product [Boreogadus saida]
MEGQVAAPHPKGLEVEANLEGLEAVGLEGLEAAVGSNLEGLEVVVETGLEASGGARREVRGGRLEALAAGGGKAGSRRAAQRMQNEGLRRRSWRQRPDWRRRWHGGPGGGMEGQVADPHPKGLEVEANLEGLEAAVGSNLEGLEAVVGTTLEVPAVASTWRRTCVTFQKKLGDVAEVQAVGPVEVLEETVPAVEVRRRLVIRPTSSSFMEGLKESLGMKITAQGLTTPPPPPPHLSGEASSWCRRSNLQLFEETKQLNG